MNQMEMIHRYLSFPAMYRLGMQSLGAPNARKFHTSNYIKAKAGQRILDVGCGPADILEYLPAVDYVGIDFEAKYIENARMRFGHKAQFRCKDVAELAEENFEPFDIVLATGLLHHPSDQECLNLFAQCIKLLKPDGRMVTYDGCRRPGQHPLDLWMLNNDRGKFVRTEDGYYKLASSVFSSVKINLHSNLLRIPYTLAIMELNGSRNLKKPQELKAVTEVPWPA